MGYPLRGWWNHEQLDSGYFMQIAPMVPMLDPNYVNEFWTTPGYLGHDPASGLADLRFTFDTTVSTVTPGFPPLFELSDVPARDFSHAHLIIIDRKSDVWGKVVSEVVDYGVCCVFKK